MMEGVKRTYQKTLPVDSNRWQSNREATKKSGVKVDIDRARRRAQLEPSMDEVEDDIESNQSGDSGRVYGDDSDDGSLESLGDREEITNRTWGKAAAGGIDDEQETGGTTGGMKGSPFPKVERVQGKSRANKNRPQEVSSSRAVGRFREVVKSKHQNSRDPRFEGGSASKLNYDIFRKAYSFLDVHQEEEITALKKSLTKEKNKERSRGLQEALSQLQQQRAQRVHGERHLSALQKAKQEERVAVAAGKKPFFLKSKEKKRISLEQRYAVLKEEGKLKKFMEKKRKQNASKDHRWLPAKRRARDGSEENVPGH